DLAIRQVQLCLLLLKQRTRLIVRGVLQISFSVILVNQRALQRLMLTQHRISGDLLICHGTRFARMRIDDVTLKSSLLRQLLAFNISTRVDTVTLRVTFCSAISAVRSLFASIPVRYAASFFSACVWRSSSRSFNGSCNANSR